MFRIKYWNCIHNSYWFKTIKDGKPVGKHLKNKSSSAEFLDFILAWCIRCYLESIGYRAYVCYFPDPKLR